jgi:hypothetical protein
MGILRCMREDVLRKLSDIWCTQDWLQRHENTPAHAAFSVQQFLTENYTVVVPYRYSLDLVLVTSYSSQRYRSS